MEVLRHDDPTAFADRVAEYLLASPGRHSLFFSILDILREHPESYASFVLLTAERADEVLGVAVRTAPYGVVIARPATEEAPASLADAMLDLDPTAPGVVGGRPEADAFAARWTQRRGGSLRVESRQGLYELTSVRDRGSAAGTVRSATPADLPLLFDWEDAFTREAVPGHPAGLADRRRRFEQILAADGFRLWEHEGRVVSMTGVHPAPPIGARIGPVYTPPPDRGNGYATALVAAASAEQLAQRRPACYLATDLANPTSNAIYRRIGYEWICEAIDLRFGT